jgi:hypothetical protein
MEQTYTSKVDAWLVALLIGALLLCVLAGFTTFSAVAATGNWTPFISGTLPLLIVGAGLPAWMCMSVRYTLNDDTLKVKAGFFSWQVPVAEITAIAPTRNPLSSPALSLDRLRIDYSRGKAIMISPKLKEQFLQDLEARRAKLKI